VGGTVVTIDSRGDRVAVARANVQLSRSDLSRQSVADDQGRYSFADVPTGEYRIEATAPGMSGSNQVAVSPGVSANVTIELRLNAIRDSVNVSADAESPLSMDSSADSTINRSTVMNAPNKYDRADAVLPLVPGVVRGPDGLINMKGARSSQGGSLVNSANVTDPATGNTALSLPIDVVESVKVIANPYDAEYGRLSGAVSSIETVTGNFNALHITAQNLLVRPRKRAGDFVGIESATPRLTLTGPLVKNKIAFTQSIEYRFIRTPVSSLPQLQRDIKLEGFNSFSQLDANLNSQQSLTAGFMLYPQKINYLGLNTFMPQSSTPDLHQRGYMAYVQHRETIGANSLIISQVNYKRFDADVTPNSTDPYQLLVETTTGGFFNRQSRNTTRTEWQETYQHTVHGAHNFKAGFDYARSDYDGRVQLLPVTLVGIANLPIESITFGPPSRFDIHQNEFAWFLADHWTVSKRMALDLGVRFDRDSITESINTAPRGGFALMLTSDAKTILKGGAGLFYDRVPLNVASFPLLPDRTVSVLALAGGIVSSTPYLNQIPYGLRNPRSVGWNVELDRQLTSGLVVRAGFQQRNTSRDFALTPDANALTLLNSGRSFYREFQITAQYKIRRGTLNASYVRSKAFGNLNDFNQFFGNTAFPFIQPDERGRLPFDAPNRVIAWGQWNAPFKLTVLPVVDVHTGFPYSVFDQAREFVGPRDSQRFPTFASVDLQITRPISIHLPHEKFHARVGFSVYNVLNHFNPRDVQGDIDSERFEALFNGVGRTFRGKFILEF
jgi:hypothetical protein